MIQTRGKTGQRKRKLTESSVDQLLESTGARNQAQTDSAIPLTFFFQYSTTAPLIIHEGTAYQITNHNGTDDHFVFAGTSFGLEKAGTLAELENFYQENHQDAIKKFKEAYVQEKTSEQLASHEQVKRELVNNRVLGFIINDLIPYFDSGASVDDVLNGTESTTPKRSTDVVDHIMETVGDIKVDARKLKELEKEEMQIDKELEMILRNYHKAHSIRPETNEDSPLLQKLVGNDLCTLGDTVFVLSRQRNPAPAIIIDNVTYGLERFEKIENVESNYQKLLEQHFKREALRENHKYKKMLVELEKEAKAFEKFSGIREFTHGDFGFTKREGGSYAVWTNVPEYVLKEPRTDAYYHFPACKVAVNISSRGSEIINDLPYILGKAYPHPFTNRDSHSNQSICLGNFNYERIQHLQAPERIVKLLSVSKNVLTRGYNSGANPYRRLGDMTSHMISKSEVERKGLPITNFNARARGEEYD